MDEITLVRDLYGPHEPDPAARERIRTRLTAPPPRPRRFGRTRTTFGLGLAAAATAAVLLGTALLPGGPAQAPASNVRDGADPAARTILLAAADRAAADKTGRYWRLHVTSAQTFRVGGEKGYNIEGMRMEWDAWTAPSPDVSDVRFERDMPAQPQTSADKAAWRRAGSPTTWQIGSGTGSLKITAEARSSWRTAEISPAAKRRHEANLRDECRTEQPAGDHHLCGLALVPEAEWERLIADPDRLSRLLLAHRRVHDHQTTPVPATGGDPLDLLTVYDFLVRNPLPPAARAAVLKLMADIPGLRSIGTVRDTAGRSGIGLAARGVIRCSCWNDGTVYDQVVILDPKTHRFLGQQQRVVRPGGWARGMTPGTVLRHGVIHHMGWTDDKPEHP